MAVKPHKQGNVTESPLVRSDPRGAARRSATCPQTVPCGDSLRRLTSKLNSRLNRIWFGPSYTLKIKPFQGGKTIHNDARAGVAVLCTPRTLGRAAVPPQETHCWRENCCRPCGISDQGWEGTGWTGPPAPGRGVLGGIAGSGTGRRSEGPREPCAGREPIPTSAGRVHGALSRHPGSGGSANTANGMAWAHPRLPRTVSSPFGLTEAAGLKTKCWSVGSVQKDTQKRRDGAAEARARIFTGS